VEGHAAPNGSVSFRKINRVKSAPLWWKIQNSPNYFRGVWRDYVATFLGIGHFTGSLKIRVLHRDGSITDYGEVSRRVVTTAGVNAIVDAFQNSVELETFIYHGFGTGGTAEAVGDTTLVTELTTEYVVDNTRPTGSNTEGAGANVYRTVGTLDPDSAVAITEHGVFSQASNAGGILLDRSLFSVINVAATGDTLEATYDLTFTAGS